MFGTIPQALAEFGLSHVQAVGFPIKKVPSELRLKIFAHEVDYQSNGRLPPLIVALGADKELYEEAREIYKKVNLLVFNRNQDDFRVMPMKELFKIRHLTIVVPSIEQVILFLQMSISISGRTPY